MDMFAGYITEPSSEAEDATRDQGRGSGGGRRQESGKEQDMALEFATTQNDAHSGWVNATTYLKELSHWRAHTEKTCMQPAQSI